MKGLNILAWIFVVVGGLNLGLVGAFNFDLVWRISGFNEGVARTIYVLCGAATLYLLGTMIAKEHKVGVN